MGAFWAALTELMAIKIDQEPLISQVLCTGSSVVVSNFVLLG